jgi:Fe2+ or Zn2+ uptake regulation protein
VEEVELDQVVVAIEKHLSEYPSAADAVEGIAAWWLGRDCPDISRDVVERALRRMVDSGFLRERRMENGTVIYALRKGAG